MFIRLLLVSLVAASVSAAPAPPKNAPPPPHGFFSRLVRLFGRVESFDPSARTLTVVTDAGERLTLPLKLDTDVFLNELPAEPAALRPNDRVWLAMEGNAERKQYDALRFVADEPTYQALHGTWYTVKSVEPVGRIVRLTGQEGEKTLDVEVPASPDFELVEGSRRKPFADLRPGMIVRYQSRHRVGRYELSRAVSQLAWSLEKARVGAAIDAALQTDGLPAQAHAGEAPLWTILVQRTGSAWARHLRSGSRVTLAVSSGASHPAEVREIGPWGEKTRVVLRLGGGVTLAADRLLRLRMDRPEPGPLPAGLGISTEPEERVEWFLSSIYCTCSIAGDRCTGHLYTLAMCDHAGCGKPNAMKSVLRGLIRQGFSDAEILRKLEADEGPGLLSPHLLR